MLITFEGVEGSGKTTQVELLYGYLQGKGYKRPEDAGAGRHGPGRGPAHAYCCREDLHVLPLSELLVFMAVRAQHMEEVIMPALERGAVVLCDRFADATYVYQGYGRGVDLGIISTLNRLVTKGVMPNLTVLLDCEATAGLARKRAGERVGQVRGRRGRLPRADQAGLPQARRRRPKGFFVVNGKGGVEAIHETIRDRVEKLLESHGI